MTAWRALPRRSRSIIAAAAVLVVAVLVVLTVTVTASGTPSRRGPLPAAKPFTLGKLGHPGQQVSLGAFAGQPVIVNFFASWCGPCRRETPLLAGFYARHHGQIHIIGIDSNDATAKALKFVAREHVSYPVAVDPFPANTAIAYGVQAGLPQTFFLNARHRIVRHVIGGVTAGDLSAWAAQLSRTGR
jgi:cytochrome c biogenesis protein CcmG, thiol:disulfide interchange protein DsbE